MTRDPRSDPQPGDEVRAGPFTRRVFRRKGAWLFAGGPRTRYRMRVDAWQKWCEESGAEVVAVGKQEE